MKKEISGSWKKHYDYRFISGEDRIRYRHCRTREAVGIDEAFNGHKQEDVVVISFEETEKMMVLNKTNAKTITKRTGTVNVEEWKGFQLRLTCMTVSAFGQQVLAIRVVTDE